MSKKAKVPASSRMVFHGTWIAKNVAPKYRKQFESNMDVWDPNWRKLGTCSEAVLNVQLLSAVEMCKKKKLKN